MNNAKHRARGLRGFGLAGLLALVATFPSCATVTGLTTGAFTGFVDLPNEMIRINEMDTDQGGTWLVAIIAAPVGFAMGPFYGMVKGVALDVGATTGSVPRSEQFDSYDRASIWRPYAWGWGEDWLTHPSEITQELENMGQ